MMMKCEQCKNNINEADRYCGSCGSPVNEQQKYLRGTKGQRITLRLCKFIWCICILILNVGWIVTMIGETWMLPYLGPALFFLAAINIPPSKRLKFSLMYRLSVSHMLLCIGVLIGFNQRIFIINQPAIVLAFILLIYSTYMSMRTWTVMWSRLPILSPWFCKACEYLLVGLDRKGNCPECGTYYTISEDVDEPQGDKVKEMAEMGRS
ncbi:hypothetical protein JD969_01470 [Planctomycetota bacterium]|nr:hypothetical protein JD969_01470 [Planctomycetota bacterium]